MIYRPVFFRILSFWFCFLALLLFLSIFEVGHFVGHTPTAQIGIGGGIVCLLLLVTTLIGSWSWKKYGATTFVLGAILLGGYFYLWPSYWQKDATKVSSFDLSPPLCPLTLDRYFYRTFVIKNDPQREEKIADVEDFCRAVKIASEFSSAENYNGHLCPMQPDLRLDCFIGLVKKTSEARPIGPFGQMLSAAIGMKLALATHERTGSVPQTLLSFGKVSGAQIEILKSWFDRDTKK